MYKWSFGIELIYKSGRPHRDSPRQRPPAPWEGHSQLMILQLVQGETHIICDFKVDIYILQDPLWPSGKFISTSNLCSC